MQQLRFYFPQWLYSTRFGRQFHPSSGVHMLYMATGKPLAYLWPYTAYVLLMTGEIVARNMWSKAIAENKNAIVASCWTYFTPFLDFVRI